MIEPFLDRHYLLVRRLHSLSGLFPIGVFLFPHLTTNSSIVWGRMLMQPNLPAGVLADAGVMPNAGVETFQHEVNFIHDLPALVLIEWGLLFIPLLFHSLAGIWFARSGRSNVARYAYQDNWRYTLQRVTGYIGIVYIFLHITSLRFGWTYAGMLPTFDPHHAASTTAAHLQKSLLVPLLYLVGVSALVFHFANGLWTAAITWGLTVSTAAQKRWGYVCAMIGVALGLAALASIFGFAVLDVDEARTIETLLGAANP